MRLGSRKQEWSLRGVHVYGATEVLSEKVARKSMQDERLRFVLKTVLPNITLGPSQWGSSMSMLKGAIEKVIRPACHNSPSIYFWAVSEPFKSNNLSQDVRKEDFENLNSSWSFLVSTFFFLTQLHRNLHISFTTEWFVDICSSPPHPQSYLTCSFIIRCPFLCLCWEVGGECEGYSSESIPWSR